MPVDEYQRWSSPQVRKRSEQLAKLLERFHDTPSERFTEPLRKQAANLAKTTGNVELVFEAFMPFITANEFRFSAKNTRALMASLTPADRERLPWQPEAIDWRHYWLHVHHKGVGICGVYTYEVAETKVTQVMDFSRQHGHPLQCTMEKE